MDKIMFSDGSKIVYLYTRVVIHTKSAYHLSNMRSLKYCDNGTNNSIVINESGV